MNDLEVHEADPEDRLPIYRMLELCQHDLSDIWDQEIDAHGEYGYAIDRYWSSKDCKAFVARMDGRYAGFALVDRESKVGEGAWWMDQFFVLKKYRGRGIGGAVATSVFTALPGSWEVGQMSNNLPAQKFWRRVISRHTDGRYVEHELAGGWWEGFVQCFQSPDVQQLGHALSSGSACNKEIVPMRWTHFTLPVSDLNGSIRFFTDICGLAVVRDRRLEGGSTVWLGPAPRAGEDPEFVVVISRGEVREPLDHFGFQCEHREDVTAIAQRARDSGTLVEGPTDFGGSVGYFAVVREPSGHLVEFTHGQPLGGLGRRDAG